MRAKDFLVEMIIRHREEEPGCLVAHRDSIWLVNDETSEQVWAEIEAKTGIEAHDTQSLMDEKEERPDVLITYYDDNRLYIDGIGHSSHNPYTSKLLLKVAKQLGLQGYTASRMGHHGDEWEDQIDRHEMHGEIPEIAYHGTCLRHIRKIMRFGLRPDVEHTNWENVGKFPDRVFLATDINKALFHANDAATKNHSKGIIIEVRIPDKRLIDLDYDVASAFYGDSHPDVHHSYRTTHEKRRQEGGYVDQTHLSVQKHSPKTNFTRETGIFSYKGRIPASFITAVHLNGSEDEEDFISPHHIVREPDLREFMDYLDDYEEFGYYDRYAFEEMRWEREQEQED